MTTVYVAASSRDIARAKRWTMCLLECGIRVASTWIDLVESLGEANPRHATRETRMRIADGCISEVRCADILWLLTPPTDAPSVGAWIEYGIAYSCGLVIVASGDTKQTVFTAARTEAATDTEAFAQILRDHASGLYTP